MQRRMVLMSNDEMPREWEIVIYFLALSLESHEKKRFISRHFHEKENNPRFVCWHLLCQMVPLQKKFAFALYVLSLICICLGHAYVTSVFDVWIFCFLIFFLRLISLPSFASSLFFLPLPPLLSSFHFLQRYVCLSAKRPASNQHPTAWVRIALDRWESVCGWLLVH